MPYFYQIFILISEERVNDTIHSQRPSRNQNIIPSISFANSITCGQPKPNFWLQRFIF